MVRPQGQFATHLAGCGKIPAFLEPDDLALFASDRDSKLLLLEALNGHAALRNLYGHFNLKNGNLIRELVLVGWHLGGRCEWTDPAESEGDKKNEEFISVHIQAREETNAQLGAHRPLVSTKSVGQRPLGRSCSDRNLSWVVVVVGLNPQTR